MESMIRSPGGWQIGKPHGYIPQVMTGVAWGMYQDFTFGRWDGHSHMDEAQTMQSGERIGHGNDMYYMSPSEAYGRYLCVGVKRALDAGATGIYLEEPEFWVRAGWSEGFKREWQAYYHEPWIDPVSSPDSQYRASKLKYYLYRRALSQVFDFVKEYGKAHNRTIPCYVPTHSLINYASWGIVSPESSLLKVGCDGYIAQVWTGTSRTPNFYEGIKKERTFETAFLEYGVMQNLVRASGRRVWYENDPVEDDPEEIIHGRIIEPTGRARWWHRSCSRRFGATRSCLGRSGSLMGSIQPTNPFTTTRRVFPSRRITRRNTAGGHQPAYMGDMKQPLDQIKWLSAGTPGVGVLVSDTMMFQRFGPDHSDGDLGSFYGLSLPLLMRGIPVEPAQIETADLSPYKVLLLTYEGQKPPDPKFHESLARWVRAGGALVVIDDDQDPFNQVREWWNTGEKHFATPRHDLFVDLGLPHNAVGTTKVGNGFVIYASLSPAELSHVADGAIQVRRLVREAMRSINVQWKESSGV